MYENKIEKKRTTTMGDDFVVCGVSCAAALNQCEEIFCIIKIFYLPLFLLYGGLDTVKTEAFNARYLFCCIPFHKIKM